MEIIESAGRAPSLKFYS